MTEGMAADSRRIHRMHPGTVGKDVPTFRATRPSESRVFGFYRYAGQIEKNKNAGTLTEAGV